MTKKQEERDWSEIMAEVRNKAKSEIDEFVDEIKPRVEELVKKVREANFHDEAEELLSKLKTMADEFAHSEDGPAKTKTAATGPGEMHYDDKGVGYKIGPSGRIEWAKFLTPDGKQHIRKPRAKGKTWSKTQEKEYMQAFIKKHGK